MFSLISHLVGDVNKHNSYIILSQMYPWKWNGITNEMKWQLKMTFINYHDKVLVAPNRENVLTEIIQLCVWNKVSVTTILLLCALSSCSILHKM